MTSDEALRHMLVPVHATIMDALVAINRGACGAAFVVDSRGRVVGVLTDGDLRRALIDGADLQSRCLQQAMQSEFTSVGVDASRVEVLELMRAREIDQIPIINSRGRLVGLHLLQQLIGAHERENWAVIMAGGKGTRLGPLTKSIPKPMISVAGRPILERIVLHLVGWGIRRIFISVNHLAHLIEDHFRDGKSFGCHIEYLRESRPLGTGGPLVLLRRYRPKLPVLVMNGDLITQFNVGGLLNFHHERGYVATFGVRPYSFDVPFGVARVSGDQLIALDEKPTERMLINAGIYTLSPEAFSLLPRKQEAFPITALFERCLSRELEVGAYLIEEEWMDVGRPDELARARGTQ